MSDDLSSFFNIISEGKKKQEDEFNSLLGEDFFGENFLENLLESANPKKEKKESPDTSDEDDDEEDSDDEIEESAELNYVDQYLQFIKKTEKPKEVSESLDNPSSKEIQELKNLVWQLMRDVHANGGGGETRLEFLDDVDRNSAKTDNYYLKYDATINKWVGDPADGAGITSIVSISGVTTYYQSTDIDDYIGVSADVPVTIVLPQIPSYGKKLIVKDEGNKINTYNITVQAGIGKSVENDSSVVMKINHQSFTYFYNGNNWYII
jgi:hypothetical protein